MRSQGRDDCLCLMRLMVTRFLQAMFGAERTMFLVVLRHPLSVFAKDPHRRKECGAHIVNAWIDARKRLFIDDIAHLKNVVVVHYELMMQGDIRCLLLHHCIWNQRSSSCRQHQHTDRSPGTAASSH